MFSYKQLVDTLELFSLQKDQFWGKELILVNSFQYGIFFFSQITVFISCTDSHTGGSTLLPLYRAVRDIGLETGS